MMTLSCVCFMVMSDTRKAMSLVLQMALHMKAVIKAQQSSTDVH